MLPASEIAAVQARFLADMTALLPGDRAVCRRVLQLISGPNWRLEWSLPHWLGLAFGLPPAASQELVLSNVYGLAYVRLHDDLMDDEADELLNDDSASLLEVLYHMWLSTYEQLFDRSSDFWPHFERYMAQWRASCRPPTVRFGAFSEDDFLHLAHRGAPLKLCCVGACLLGARESAIPALTSAIDRWLVAAVLLDHAHDWADDLAKGHYNAFVDYATPGVQTPDQRVLEMIYLGDGVQGYYAHVQRHIAMAVDAARAARSPQLDAYLAWFAREAVAYHDGTIMAAKTQLRAVTERLFSISSAGDTVTAIQDKE